VDAAVSTANVTDVPALLGIAIGGFMGKRVSPGDLTVLDRRQLLLGASATTAISALPASEPAPAAPREIETTNLAGWSHFSAVTRSRLEEIAFRNGLRKEAGLPLLSIAKELRRMKTVADEERFRRFAELHLQVVRNNVLKLVRDEKGDPSWRPTGWIVGIAFQARVDEILIPFPYQHDLAM
jgi:hypothetical protein